MFGRVFIVAFPLSARLEILTCFMLASLHAVQASWSHDAAYDRLLFRCFSVVSDLNSVAVSWTCVLWGLVVLYVF